MAERLKYIVLTCDDIEAASVVNYLIRTTGLSIDSIYIDTRTDIGKRYSPAPDSVERPATRLQTAWWNFRLALKLRRSWCLRLLESLTGLTDLGFLLRCERTNLRLFRAMCGFPFDTSLANAGPLLYTLDEVSKMHGIPIFRTPNVNDDSTVESIRERQPDIIIGLGTRILKRRLLDIPRIGCLNGHSSLLPAYRGSRSEFWQLASGETRTGVTIHWMADRVDQGEICVQRDWQIPRGADHNKLRLMSLFYRLDAWKSVIKEIEAGGMPRQAQSRAPTPTFRRPSTRQMFEFYCKGIRPGVCGPAVGPPSQLACVASPAKVNSSDPVA